MKYRFWDTFQKRWLNPNNYVINNEGIVENRSGLQLNSVVVLNSVGMMSYDETEDEFYLKEMFIGDIVKMHQFLFDGSEYEVESYGVIDFKDGSAYFTEIYVDGDDLNDYDTGWFINTVYGLHEESFVVVGNIYENNDMLKTLSSDNVRLN